MIRLLLPEGAHNLEAVTSKIKDLSLACCVEYSTDLSEIVLYDNEVSYRGVAAIMLFLEDLASELPLWHYARC